MFVMHIAMFSHITHRAGLDLNRDVKHGQNFISWGTTGHGDGDDVHPRISLQTKAVKVHDARHCCFRHLCAHARMKAHAHTDLIESETGGWQCEDGLMPRTMMRMPPGIRRIHMQVVRLAIY